MSDDIDDLKKIEILNSDGELITFEELVKQNKNVQDAIKNVKELGMTDEELLELVQTVAKRSKNV